MYNYTNIFNSEKNKFNKSLNLIKNNKHDKLLKTRMNILY
jgi:hypothetical protein